MITPTRQLLCEVLEIMKRTTNIGDIAARMGISFDDAQTLVELVKQLLM